MRFNNIIISYFLVLVAIISFFVGFSLDEISMGAGGFNGDFKFVKKSIALFSQNSFFDSIKLYSETSNRPPLIYILHKYLNPLIDDELGFRKVVFTISLLIPILFYICLRERFKETDKNIILLFSSIIFFNPFIRTSSYWGLEENYAIISSLLSILFLMKLPDISNNSKKYFYVLLLTFFSSLTIYFDQKFLIIPIICFLNIFLGNHDIRFKTLTILLYLIFSIPYLMLIKLWGGIFPSDIYHVGSQFYYHHFGYALTIIAFIFFPFILIKSKITIEDFFQFLNEKKLLFILFLIITFYLIILFFFYDISFINNRLDGGGIVKKLSLLVFNDGVYRKVFIFISILISWFFIFYFLERNIINLILTSYFLLFSLIVKPFYQEYFDPILILLLIFIFKINFKITHGRVFILYFYFMIFLFGTNLYYN